MARRLRSGYTTGACAAAAAKTAVLLLVGRARPRRVEIPFPDGSRHGFVVHQGEVHAGVASSSVLKDAGDDPDVTNGAEIVATASFLPPDFPHQNSLPTYGGGLGWEGNNQRGRSEVHPPPNPLPSREGELNCVRLEQTNIFLCGGEGVGWVTKKGLAVKPGEPAINPVPRKMILAAVLEALGPEAKPLQIVISVPRGEELAEKTLNKRLGIVGGLSILGTTGIVHPVSAEAWTATIEASLAVAKATGLTEIVLSTGRTSEKGAQTLLSLPEEAFAMMGDYLEFSLLAAAKQGFTKIHLAGMWAKIMKAALQTPQTHVRHGALEVADGLALLARLGAEQPLLASLQEVNTAREIHERLQEQGREDLIRGVCEEAQRYAQKVSGLEVRVYLVNSHTKVELHV
ncbi:MAG: cobalt-precorrin-5B (C(1))-methyltransferase [Desulfurivibrio sp.]|nr:cobalt-precorrin-5B (C(1))-methyltransferase [Desulfurivibrio sp.]MBU3937262.1 cobalt-precorrin-5B (C(1))-methyltransferase CbiD [Pseudomonadota bacterium]MBU4034306.1 cobalt-precorrin-5B (C(1))-methyltransferase CbiD [Pseudomonadota bacterium]MBU4117707.1 cobalt-precorrin-5B (C(1))-methyltransferase CbiD [Pseudomonadota bacterium]